MVSGVEPYHLTYRNFPTDTFRQIKIISLYLNSLNIAGDLVDLLLESLLHLPDLVVVLEVLQALLQAGVVDLDLLLLLVDDVAGLGAGHLDTRFVAFCINLYILFFRGFKILCFL